MKSKFLKILIVILILGAIFTGGYFLFNALGLDDIDKLREIVNDNWLGVFIFILILIFQVIFLPAGTLAFSGTAVVLFGESPLKAWLICWTGLAIGSYIMFFLARFLGMRVMKWIVGEQKAEKYANFLAKGKFILPMLLLVPIFPDDIICAAAGLSSVNWLYFMVVITLTRGIDNFCTVFIGSEMLKTTTGIILLGIFVVAMLIAAYFLTKHQEKIENWLVDKFSSKKNKTAIPEPKIEQTETIQPEQQTQIAEQNQENIEKNPPKNTE